MYREAATEIAESLHGFAQSIDVDFDKTVSAIELIIYNTFNKCFPELATVIDVFECLKSDLDDNEVLISEIVETLQVSDRDSIVEQLKANNGLVKDWERI